MSKHLLLLTVFLVGLSGLTASAQPAEDQEVSLKKKEVPKAVLEAFLKAYPKATIKEYSRETDEGKFVYEIGSVEGKVHRDVSYTADGAVITIEESLPPKELPTAVRKGISATYPKGKVSRAEKITAGEKLQYEVLVTSGTHRVELVLNPDGTIAETEKK